MTQLRARRLAGMPRRADFAYTTIAYNSCRKPSLSQVPGHRSARELMAAREVERLPVPYFQIVFTLPSAISYIAMQH